MLYQVGPSMLAHSCPVVSHAKSRVPPLHHTSVNLPELIYHETLISFSLCQKLKLESASKWATDALQPEVWLPTPVMFMGTGVPWALVSLSCSWAAPGGVASCPGSTSRVCPSTAAPRSPPHHSLQEQKQNKTTWSPQCDEGDSCCRSRHNDTASSHPDTNLTTTALTHRPTRKHQLDSDSKQYSYWSSWLVHAGHRGYEKIAISRKKPPPWCKRKMNELSYKIRWSIWTEPLRTPGMIFIGVFRIRYMCLPQTWPGIAQGWSMDDRMW